MAELTPLLLIAVMIPVILYVVWSENQRAKRRYKINRKQIETNYSQFFTEEGLQSLKVTDMEDIDIEYHNKQDHLSAEYVEISPELLKYKFLMNPVRLGVIGLLYKYSDYQQSEIRKALDISWGQFSAHVNSLEKEGYISISNQFIEGNSSKILFLKEKGRIEFRELRIILKTIIRS